MRRLLCGGAAACACLLVVGLSADSVAPPAAGGLRWRLVGPHRAGRVWAVAGVAGDPAVYYAGTPAGALWKTTNGGTTWSAVSDALPVTGIGAVAVSASNPSVVYVGTGSNTLGRGVFRSKDAGATWEPAGLEDSKYIAAMVVDPSNPDVVVAGVGAGGNFGSMVFYNNNPSPARGIYRTTDGGRTWSHTLFVDAATPVVDLASAPDHPSVIYASLSNGLYRSTDAGRTWQRPRAQGLADGGMNIAVAPGTRAMRVYALGGGRGRNGLFRSDDGGDTFSVMTTRLASAGGHLVVDPRNPDVVYTMGTSVYRSTDGGRTLDAIKGAPGGDDPHAIWIDPTNPARMIVGADQGPTISVDAGASWTPWYTMPNGEFYFLSTDAGFPWRIYAAQQDSGTVSIASRSDFGAIRPNDWYPVAGYEQGHIFADPRDGRYVYSHGGGHTIVRYDRVTGQAGPVFMPAADDRFGPRPGMDLSPKDPAWMFVGSQFVHASNDRVTWARISGDLTSRPDRPANGTITAIAASPLDAGLLWVGTSNGLVHVTKDRGQSWASVAPARLAGDAALTVWSIEASPHDAGVAYVSAIDTSDRHGPALFMTSDYGASWREIGSGLPADVPTRAVREDPALATLLYAATQRGVFVSFDRGATWHSLQRNLPAVPVNDLTVHGDDLVAATWGRGLWVLDNVTPLRQQAAAQSASGAVFLYEPATATRVRWDNNQDTPLPPELPQGQNPPDGVAIDYELRAAASGPVRLTIRDGAGRVVRTFTSDAPPPDSRMPNVPESWFARPATLATTVGAHRLVWDLREPTPPSLDVTPDGLPMDTVSYGIIATAVRGESPKQQPVGPLVPPGRYTIELTHGTATATRTLTIVNDPRSPASAADLLAQVAVERRLVTGVSTVRAAIDSVRGLRERVRQGAASVPLEAAAAAEAFDKASRDTLVQLTANRRLGTLIGTLEFADAKPTPSVIAAVSDACSRAQAALDAYHRLAKGSLDAFNAAAHPDGLGTVRADAVPVAACNAEATR